MLRHIITMSQDLGLECIVEGVETAEQVKLLKDCKCYLAQGFISTDRFRLRNSNRSSKAQQDKNISG